MCDPVAGELPWPEERRCASTGQPKMGSQWPVSVEELEYRRELPPRRRKDSTSIRQSECDKGLLMMWVERRLRRLEGFIMPCLPTQARRFSEIRFSHRAFQESASRIVLFRNPRQNQEGETGTTHRGSGLSAAPSHICCSLHPPQRLPPKLHLGGKAMRGYSTVPHSHVLRSRLQHLGREIRARGEPPHGKWEWLQPSRGFPSALIGI